MILLETIIMRRVCALRRKSREEQEEGWKGKKSATDKLASLTDGDPSCQDDDEECEGWASDGECDDNPKFMHAKCKKSCHRC